MVINDLVAKPELNGHTGMTLIFDDDKGRYSVELDGTSSSLLIMSCNLSQTKKQEEDADRAMRENHQKSETGRARQSCAMNAYSCLMS